MSNYKALKEKASKSYFDSIIFHTLSSSYTLESLIIKNDSELIIGVDIELACLDRLISWKLSSCWLTRYICPQNPEDFFENTELS